MPHHTSHPDRSADGFTLIELMIVVVIIGILAAIGIPNFISMQNRAKEGSTKSNMHAFQLAAEDYGVQNDGAYADQAPTVALLLPAAGDNFANPFDRSTGDGNAWKDQAAYSPVMDTGSNVKGIVAYADSVNMKYCIASHGVTGDLALHLLSGQQ